MTAPDIVATIDHVLADCNTSDDAMRWTPDPQPVDTTPAPLDATCAACIPDTDGRVDAHAHADGRLIACRPVRCPGCTGCERSEED